MTRIWTLTLVVMIGALAAPACASPVVTAHDAAPPGDSMVSLDGGGEGHVTAMTDAAPGDATVTSALDVNTYFDEFFGTLCAWLVRCEPKLGAAAFGEVSCHPLRREAVRAQFLAGLSAGATDFEPAVARECLAELSAATCNVASVDLTRCDDAFVGRAFEGQPCATDLACREGVCSVGARCPGSCVVQHEGDVCARPSECARGLTCRDGSCAPPATSGQPCSRRTDCAYPLTCGAAGACQAPAGPGESCATSLGGDLCGGDDVCRDGLCAAGAGVGSACSRAAPCAPGGRCIDETCVATGVAGTSCEVGGCIALHACVGAVCVPLPHRGAACSVELPCVQGACRDGVCSLLSAGEECDGDVQFGECEGFCRSSTCEAPLDEGALCRSSSQCGPDLSCREAAGPGRCLPACW